MGRESIKHLCYKWYILDEEISEKNVHSFKKMAKKRTGAKFNVPRLDQRRVRFLLDLCTCVIQRSLK